MPACQSHRPSHRHLADPAGSPPGFPTRTDARSTGQAPGSRRILIVEDEFMLALAIEEMVQEIGYTVCDAVATAPAAVAAAERHRPDVVLMDIRLAQGTDGVEAARMIRDRLGIRSIFISAHTDAATVSRMRTVDPIGVLTKPCEAPLLAAVLRRAFEPPN